MEKLFLLIIDETTMEEVAVDEVEVEALFQEIIVQMEILVQATMTELVEIVRLQMIPIRLQVIETKIQQKPKTILHNLLKSCELINGPIPTTSQPSHH
jgi:hypothetical protein